MIKIVKKVIPHGNVSVIGIQDPYISNVIMRLSENIVSLSKQLSAAQSAIIELQKEVRK